METNQNEKNTPEQDLEREAPEQTAPEQTDTEQAAPVQESPEREPVENEAPAETGSAEQEPVQQEIEQKPAPQPEKPQKKGSFTKMLKSDKFKRGGMATLLSVVFLAIVVVVNVLMGVLTDRFPSMDIDLTAQKLNSLSDQAAEIARGVEQETSIYLIGSEEAYREDRIYASYGLKFSQVANLAEKLQEVNSKISVEFVDPDTNPGFISEYPSETLITGTVLVKTEKRYKVLSPSDMFTLQTNQSTYQTETYTKVDSALATALEVVNMDTVPVLTIATGHDEMLAGDLFGSFTDMMEGQNFEVREIDFLTDEIPEDTQLLMLPTPSTDYTTEEIDKIRAYLDDENTKNERALLVSCHTTQAELPKLNSFLEEWGLRAESGMVVESDASRMAAGNASSVLVDANQEVLPDNTYSNLVAPASRPLTLLFEGNGDVGTRALWTTADSAYVFTEDMEEIPEDPETAQQTVAAIGYKFVKVDGDNIRRSVSVFGSSYIFTDTFIDAPAYGNSAYIRDLMQYNTGTDGSDVAVLTEQVQTNVLDISAPLSVVTLLGLGVFSIGLPLAILVVGLVIFLRRRHL